MTVGNELPGGSRSNEPTAAAARDQSKKTEEIVNYEISRTTKTEVTEGGRVNRISVAVLVDGSYTKNDKGETVYQPRDKEEIDRIAALVRSAIGFDQKRGDQVEVVNLRFAEAPAMPLAEADRLHRPACNSPRTTSCTASSWRVMVLLGLVVLLMVVRPLVAASSPPDASRAPVAGRCRRHGGTMPAAQTRPAPRRRHQRPTAQRHRQDDRRRPGARARCTPSRCRRSANSPTSNPNETVSIIRQWLHENAGVISWPQPRKHQPDATTSPASSRRSRAARAATTRQAAAERARSAPPC